MMEKEVIEKIDELSEEMKDSLIEILKIPALGPDNGGDGELEKAKFIEDMIENFGFDKIERYDAPDDRVPSGIRPNIVATKEGKSEKNLVIIAHMDIVPEGDLDEWETDPFDPVFKDGKIYGRGSEDNGQELIAGIYLVKALTEAGVTPEMNVKVMIVSDEETGSKYGVGHIIDEGLVNKDDIVIVPDHSEEKGKKIEIVEKSGLWVKIAVHGKQGHAAMPGSTINANRVMAKYQYLVDERLHKELDQEDDLFSPPVSTFEPTKRLSNVPNVNTIPGKEVQYFDCRVLPSIDLDEVTKIFEEVKEELEKETGAEIELDFPKDKEAPKRTPEDSEVVVKLKKAVKEVLGVDPEPVGIGGGTVAALLRREDIPAVVWCSNDELAHQPNEYAVLDYMVRDCKVYAKIALD